MDYDSYPYSGSAQTCKHDSTKSIGKISKWGQITTTISDAKIKLKEQPVSIAMDASSKAFQFYKSGVLDENSGCGTKLNHALVIIGQTAKGAKAPEPVEPE